MQAKGIEIAIAIAAPVKHFDFQDGYFELASCLSNSKVKVEIEDMITLPYQSKKILACIS